MGKNIGSNCTCSEYSTPVFYKICWHLCISMPRRRTQHAHDHDLWLFFGLLFLENFDLSQLKKPPFAFNSNSTGKWSLTPRACRTTAQRVGSPPHSLQALPGCAVLGCGEVAGEHCISLGVVVTSALVLQPEVCPALPDTLCSHDSPSPLQRLFCAYLLLSHLEFLLEIKDVDRVWHHSLDELLSTDHDPARSKGRGCCKGA